MFLCEITLRQRRDERLLPLGNTTYQWKKSLNCSSQICDSSFVCPTGTTSLIDLTFHNGIDMIDVSGGCSINVNQCAMADPTKEKHCCVCVHVCLWKSIFCILIKCVHVIYSSTFFLTLCPLFSYSLPGVLLGRTLCQPSCSESMLCSQG